MCCCEGQAFDPLLGTPVPVEKYTEEVFGESIRMNEIIPYEKIEEFISR